jgi:hypothetical protein
VKPGSITSGVTPTTATGTLVEQVATLLAAFFTARPGADDAVLLMNKSRAAALTAATSGTNFGLPVVTTEAALDTIIVIDPRAVLVADSGIRVDIARRAAVEMVDNPGTPTATTVITDLWSRNLAGLKVERFVNWQALPNAVAYLETA